MSRERLRRARPVGVLKHLLNGGSIHVEGYGELVLSDKFELCVKRESASGPVHLKIDMDISGFIALAMEMSDEDFISVVAANALSSR